jgi:hypothetical protein
MNEDTSVFTAVQEDATSFCMDWPVFEADPTRDVRVNRTVFVLDGSGSRIGDAPLDAPGDHAADQALDRIGWMRCGGWHRDAFGRQTAQVLSVGATSAVRLPSQRSSAARIGSLAEEASLHLA